MQKIKQIKNLLSRSSLCFVVLVSCVNVYSTGIDCRSSREIAFHEAISSGNYSGTKKIIGQGVDVNAQDSEGYTPLFKAVMRESVLFNALERARTSALNRVDDTQHKAAVKIIRLLLRYKACPNIPTNNGSFPISTYTTSGSLTAAKLLLGCKANVNFILGPDKSPFLHSIVKGGRKELLRAFLHEVYTRASMQIKVLRKFLGSFNQHNWTSVLHIAAGNHDFKSLQLLLSYYADPNCANCYGDTPLHLAAHKGNLSEKDLAIYQAMLWKLLIHGATVHTRNRNGQTAHDIAKAQGAAYQEAFERVLAEARMALNNRKHALSRALRRKRRLS